MWRLLALTTATRAWQTPGRVAPPLTRRRAEAYPGTTALTSPPGFEDCYETLRDVRKRTNRPLLSLEQLRQLEPETAAKLASRVDTVV